MNKRISMIVASVFADSKDIMVYVYRDLEEFPSKAYIVNNGFWYKVRYNKILNRLLDSNKIKLAEQRVFVNGNVEMIFVPVSTVKPNPLNEIEFANNNREQDEW